MNARKANGAEPPPQFDLAMLPATTRIGQRVKIYAHRVEFSEYVDLGDDVILVGDHVTIGRDVKIARDSQIRAATISVGDGSEVHTGVRVLVAENFSVGKAARLAKDVSIACRNFVAGQLYYMGDGASVGYGGTMSSASKVKIGDRVTIGQHTILNANFPIEVGDNVGTGSYLAIWTHGYHFGHGPLNGTEVAYAPVKIGRNVWLGFHVTILPGVSIGENTIVAAGSVVTVEVPADVLVGGVPARVKKSIERRVVAGKEAHSAVSKVLHVWRTELQWKGCRAELICDSADRLELLAALADGSESTRVVLLQETARAPTPKVDESLVIITIDDRADLHTLDLASATLFVLRSGEMLGRTSPVVEDLRDQLRRHAMPCGDVSCFSSIDPQPFARLRVGADLAHRSTGETLS